MKRCFQRLLSKACFALSVLICVSAWAGPQDVRLHVSDSPEIEPSLKPNQKLEIPAQPAVHSPPLPEPPAPSVTLGQGQMFAISESRSLLAQYGDINPDEAGFRPDVWRYLSLNEAQQWLAEQSQTALAYLNDRRATLFRLQAEAPDGADWTFFLKRVEALEAIGKPDESAALLESLPQTVVGELRADQLFTLLAPRLGAKLACEEAMELPAPKDADVQVWQRIELFCEAAEGRFAPLELAQSMGEERGAPLASWFVALGEHMQYEVGQLPSLPQEAEPSDHAMIASLKKSEAPQTTEKALPKQPSYALMAITRLIRQQQWSEAGEWLKMLDKSDGQSAASFVAHEVVRFLNLDLHRPRSEAANSLPAFTAVNDASAADIALLVRFYGLMERFSFDVPPVTREWLLQQPKPNWQDATAAGLQKASQAGNVAGYLLQLGGWLHAHPLKDLSNETIGERIDELLYLREEELARRLAVEAILQSLQ